MRAMRPARLLWAGAVCLLAIGFAAILLGSPAAAQTEVPTGDPKSEGTVSSDPTPTVEPTRDPGSGGIVVSPEPTEPIATEPADAVETPGDPEGVPTEGNNEGIAPAVVVVVLRTADGGSVSDRTTVCVSEICQPVGAVGSGTKIEFERIVQGFHQISVVDAGPYEDGMSSISVRPGQLVSVDVTLAVSRSAGEEALPKPPPGAEGPIRSPIVVVEADPSGESASVQSSAQFAANVTGADETAMRITSLPATGSGEWNRAGAGIVFALAAAVALAGVALFARWRGAGSAPQERR